MSQGVNSCFQERIAASHGQSGKGSPISTRLSHGAAADESTEPRACGAALWVLWGSTATMQRELPSLHKAAAVKQ